MNLSLVVSLDFNDGHTHDHNYHTNKAQLLGH